MRLIARIPSILQQDISSELFAQLQRIYPEGAEGSYFQCILPFDDRRTLMVMDKLARAGLHPWWDTSRMINKTQEYLFELRREYSDHDYAECQYLQLRPPPDVYNYETSGRGGNGDLIVAQEYLSEGNFDVRAIDMFSYFVPTRIKSLLESGSFSGLQFRNTYYLPRDANAGDTDASIRSRHGFPYWELDSNRVMPPLSSTMFLVNKNGERVPAGFSGPCHPREGLGVEPELYYRASDLDKIKPFDIARTYERFQAFGAPGDRPLIVSKRFYDFCVGNGLKTGWIPLRIDPD